MRFIYEPNEGMMELIRNNIANYGEDVLYGIVEDESIHNLKFLCMYLVCEVENSYGLNVYTNPMAIVAKNEFEASRIYFDQTQKESSIMCMLEQNASKAKVRSINDN